jgi:hypothetical protein
MIPRRRLDIPLQADLYALQEHRQLRVDKKLINANRKRISHDYEVGKKVMKLTHSTELKNKLDARATGPYRIERIHTNGTVTLRTGRYHTERINI